MKADRLKKLGVLAVLLVPLSLSGCNKGEEVTEGDVNANNNVSSDEVVDTGSNVVETPPSNPIVNVGQVEDRDTSKDAEIHFIPVGLGESVLFRDGDEYMLIDSGGNKGATVNYLKNLGVKKLKYFVITQWDFDNTADAKAILDTFEIDYIVGRAVSSTAHNDAKALIKAISDKGLVLSEVNGNRVEYKIGDSNFSLLNRVVKNSKEDDNALGVYIDVDGTKIYISSDSATNQEEVKQLGNIDIYSVAMHGDSSINTEERIEALKPDYSIIPTDGKTIDYSATASLLESKGSKVYKTVDGAIVYKITDAGIEVNR